MNCLSLYISRESVFRDRTVSFEIVLILKKSRSLVAAQFPGKHFVLILRKWMQKTRAGFGEAC